MSIPDSASTVRDTDIAVIGLACRFPGAENIAAFLALLRAGREGITQFTAAELIDAGVDPSLVSRPDYVRANAMLPDPGRFDATFFGYNPREAELLDVQQRVFLETAWTAVEHAGYDPTTLEGPCGVFAGSGLNTYLLNQIAANPAAIESAGGFQVMIANDKDHLAPRTAYKLNLRGPALSIQTACSTSLVAVHLAVQSLLAGECDTALAGGVSLRVPQETGYLHQEGMILSADGHCRPFDAAASGTVGGNGVGLVMLKRATDAVADGDTIHALIRGSAINNDGAAKVGYTAPGLDGQATVIAEALAVADVSPDQIGYVEAHGTGTKLGDPIEVAALTKAFRRGTSRSGFCTLGAVKSNIGHLDAAAGIAGFIKTVLTLREREFFPTLHFQSPNPQIDFAGSPFRVACRLEPWTTTDHQPRFAGVSSFGIGGTNAHVVLTEPPPTVSSPPTDDQAFLFVVSGKTPTARDTLLDAVTRQTGNARDLAATLAHGRKAFSERAALLGPDPAHARPVASDCAVPTREVAFLFPGQGSQMPGMAAALYASDPAFRAELDRGAEALKAHLDGIDLRPWLLAASEDTVAADALTRTNFTQPALFLVCHALARRWLALGVEPTAMLGHSIGEWVAATLAGVFRFEDALRCVALRGRLMAAQPAGGMLAVSQAEADVRAILPPELEIAAINAPGQTVVSGSLEAIDAFATRLATAGETAIKLRTSHAFHSRAMQPAADGLARALRQLHLQCPQRRWISNVTGTWITDDEAVSPDYWARQLRDPVRFADGIAALLATGPTILLEVGPGRTATALARRHPHCDETHRTVLSDGESTLLAPLGRVWCAGGTVDWHRHFGHPPTRRIPSPSYPFSGDIYWIEATDRTAGRGATLFPPDRWLHLPSWQRAAPPAPSVVEESGAWGVIGGPRDWHEAVTSRLQALGAHCDPDQARRWIDLRGLESNLDPTESFLAVQATARNFANRTTTDRARWVVVTRGLARLAGETRLRPEVAVLTGPARVLPREAPHWSTRVVDIAVDSPDRTTIDQLIAEARCDEDHAVVLWREGRRWRESVVAQPVPVTRVSTADVTLITGGLGGLGRTLAEHLTDTSLVLLGRSELSEENTALLQRWQAAGRSVQYHAIDVTDKPGLIRLRDALDAPVSRIIHAAGLAASGSLLRGDTDRARAVLGPKVDGTLNLYSVFGDRLTGGLVLMSSLSARLGEFGQSDYAAANAFLDAFATACHTPEKPVVSLAWDAWKEVGMAARFGADPTLAAWWIEQQPRLIPPVAGVTAFFQAIALGEPHVLILTHALNEREVAPSRTARPAALPAGSRHPRPDLPTPFVEPVTRRERGIATIWSELLGVDPVGLDDHFFDLGGHSLLATQVLARLRQQKLATLDLAAFFSHPTVRQLASLDTGIEPPPPLQDADRPQGRAPLSFAQASLWLLDRLEGGGAHYNEFGAQTINGKLDPARLTHALDLVLQRHEILRSRFIEHDGQPAQEALPVGTVTCDVPLLDWTHRPPNETEEALASLAAMLVAEPFDLHQPPLLRARLVRRSAEQHVLLIAVHHIVFDGWSARIFFDEMVAAYRGIALPPLALQYGDYAVWQHGWIRGDHRARLETYWRKQFSPLPAPLNLPLDRPRPARQVFAGQRLEVVISSPLVAKLEGFARRHEASLFMVILAGYAALLARHATQEEVVIGSPTAGRPLAELEPLIGYFINPLPLRIDLSGDLTAETLLRRTRDTVLDGYAHQDLPFTQIVEAVGPARDPSRHALFQTMLIFQNRTAVPEAQPDGFQLTPWEPRQGPARSDLDLYLWETPQGLGGYFLYNTALFARTTVDKLARRLLTVLNYAVDHSTEPLGSMQFDHSLPLPRLGMRRPRATD